jgi:hypothetical protein
MQSGTYARPDVVRRTKQPSGDVTDFPSVSLYRHLSHSGYTGPRPKPLTMHPFLYRIRNSSFNFSASETLGPPSYSPQSTVWSGGLMSRSQPGFGLIYDEANCYNNALEKFYERVRGSIDLSIDIAEAGQTRKMFSATRQVESITKTLAGRFGSVRLASSLLLQWKYGLAPLMSTVYEASQRLHHQVINEIERVRVRHHLYDAYPTLSLVNYAESGETFKINTPCKISYTIGAAYATHDGFELSRWTSLNPVSVVYELTPYSFVADWFYDMGGYLRMLESSIAMSNSFKSGFVSRLVSCSGDVDVSSGYSVPSIRYFERRSGSFKYVEFDRTLLSSPPTPRAPTFKADLGSSRLFAAAALLGNLLGRRK